MVSFDPREIADNINLLLQDAPSKRFFVVAAAFVIFLQLSCYFEEWMYVALPGFKGYYATVAFVELLFFAVAGLVERSREVGISKAFIKYEAPLVLYMATAATLAASQTLGKSVVQYINYATATMVKSGKLVPTLVISVIWLRRNVTPFEWTAALLMVSSSTLMALGENAVEPDFNPLGLSLSALQLFLAALQGVLQEKSLKGYGATISEAMLFNNTFGIVFVIGNMHFSGELYTAASFFAGSPLALGLLLIRSATFYLGAYALTTLTKENGAGTAAAVGCARKSITVIASYVCFPKPFHFNYVLGFLLFVLADLLYLHVGATQAKDRKEGTGEEIKKLVPEKVKKLMLDKDLEEAQEKAK